MAVDQRLRVTKTSSNIILRLRTSLTDHRHLPTPWPMETGQRKLGRLEHGQQFVGNARRIKGKTRAEPKGSSLPTNVMNLFAPKHARQTSWTGCIAGLELIIGPADMHDTPPFPVCDQAVQNVSSGLGCESCAVQKAAPFPAIPFSYVPSHPLISLSKCPRDKVSEVL